MDDINQRQRVILAAKIRCFGIATIFILYATYMAAAAALLYLEAQKAVWSPEETTALVDYLYEHRLQADTRGNFSAEMFADAAEAISPLLEDGPEKTEKMCKTKWTRVSDFYALSILATDAYIQIKFIYSSILKYKARTGMRWDNTNGANINGEAAERVWNNYITQKVCGSH
jgi:hypothetical protein